MSKPTNNKAKAIVDAAAAGGWAVPAMCLYNVEGIIASVRAAEAKNSPVILQLFPWAIEYADGLLLHAAAEAAKNAKVPVAVHMDHCQSPEMVKRAADLGGFDGIVSIEILGVWCTWTDANWVLDGGHVTLRERREPPIDQGAHRVLPCPWHHH
jgi:hypothetical protein